MNPEVDQILQMSASQLAGAIAPSLAEGFAQGQASLLSIMMLMAAQEYERAADIRASENAELRVLFAELAAKVDSEELRGTLMAASRSHDASLAISVLNANNAELRRILIALQTHVEDSGDRAGQLRIWEVLKRAAARRLVKLG